MIKITEIDKRITLSDTKLKRSIIITKIKEEYILDYSSNDKGLTKGLVINEKEDETLYEMLNDFFDKTYKDVINGDVNQKNNLYGLELGSQPYLSYPSDVNDGEFKIIKLNHIGYKLLVDGDFAVIRSNSPYKIKDNYVELFNDLSVISQKVR